MKKPSQKGLGFAIMEERTRPLEIWSEEGKGTWMNLSIPVDDKFISPEFHPATA
jgi:hypothetical protein